jgi:hypothetical protein
LAAAIPGVGVFAVILTVIAVCVVMIWVSLRLSLASAASVGAQTIGLGPSWNTSKGNAWSLFFYWLIWGVIFFVVELAMIAILMPGYFQAIGGIISAGGARSPEEIEAASRAMTEQMTAMYDMTSPMAIVRLAGSYLVGTILIVLVAVAGGVAWRLMTDDRPEKHFE